MNPPFTVQGKALSPQDSALLERMVRIHPNLTNGDSDFSEKEALRLIDFVADGQINACDLMDFNATLPFTEMISAEDLRRAHGIFARHFPSLRKIRWGSFDPKQSFCPPLPEKKLTLQGIEFYLKGHSTQIDEALLRSASAAAQQLNPLLISPIRQLRIHWASSLTLPAGSPDRDELFSGVFNFGLKAAGVAMTYKLAYDLMRDLEERGMNYRLGRTPGDKISAEFWEKFCILQNKVQRQWDLLALFNPSDYHPELPNDWGLAYFQKHDTFVDDRHLFAVVAVAARYFRKGFEEKMQAFPDPQKRELARELLELVASRIMSTLPHDKK